MNKWVVIYLSAFCRHRNFKAFHYPLLLRQPYSHFSSFQLPSSARIFLVTSYGHDVFTTQAPKASCGFLPSPLHTFYSQYFFKAQCNPSFPVHASMKVKILHDVSPPFLVVPILRISSFNKCHPEHLEIHIRNHFHRKNCAHFFLYSHYLSIVYS